jgi:Transcriptional regulator, AbiEi antitoxin
MIPTVGWRAIARSQGGVVSRRQLLGHGLSSAAIGRLTGRGVLEPAARGVYLVGGAPLTYRARLWIAILATDGMLAYGTAAELWAITHERADHVHVLIPHARRVVAPARVQVHRAALPRGPAQVRDGLPVTGRCWTVVDLLSVLPASEAGQLVDRALQRRWITGRDIERRVRDYPGRPGNAQLRRLAALSCDGAAAESERRLHRLLRRAGIRGWQANYAVWVAGELIAVVDVALPAAGIAIESTAWRITSTSSGSGATARARTTSSRWAGPCCGSRGPISPSAPAT